MFCENQLAHRWMTQDDCIRLRSSGTEGTFCQGQCRIEPQMFTSLQHMQKKRREDCKQFCCVRQVLSTRTSTCGLPSKSLSECILDSEGGPFWQITNNHNATCLWHPRFDGIFHFTGWLRGNLKDTSLFRGSLVFDTFFGCFVARPFVL